MLIEMPFVKTLSPLYVVGDSHSVLFRYLTVDLPDYFPRPIVCNTLFVPKLSGLTIMEAGALNPAIVEYFRREIIIDFNGRWTFHDNNNRTVEHRTWLYSIVPPLHDVYAFETPPPILFVVGSIDLSELLRELGTDVDFIIEDAYFREDAFDGPELSLVPYGTIVGLVRRRLALVGDALREMRAIGFREVYVHSVHPPTTDDVRYFRLRHTMCAAKVRYKLAIVINRVLAELATANDCRFLDLWPAMLARGVIDPRLQLDGDHLNRDAAQLSLRALLSDLVVRRGEPSMP